MSIRIKRQNVSFTIQGDGVATVFKIDLREQLESSSAVGGFSPSGVDYAILTAMGTAPAPPAVNSATVANFIVTVTLAAALASTTGNGNDYALQLGLLIDGAV
jgi:hypothetical protein